MAGAGKRGRPLRYECSDGVGLLVLDRPERRNALSPALVDALIERLGSLAAMDEPRALVLAGAGDRAFCAGGDLGSGFGGAEGAIAIHRVRSRFADLLRALHDFPRPVVAAVGGDALGGGFGLAVACDLVVAGDGVRLGTPEVRLGLFPMMIMAELARNLPRKVLVEMMFTGRRIGAEEAARWGLVNRVVPRESVLDEARALAGELAALSPAVLALGKRAFYRMADMPVDAALDYLCLQLGLNLQAEDAMEGISAFLQKRPPRWRGR